MVNDTIAVLASEMLKWHTEGLIDVEVLVVKARYNFQERGSDVVLTEDAFDHAFRCVYALERVVLRQTSVLVSSFPYDVASGLHDSCDVFRRYGV
jgi:hypothetical protein